MKISNTADPFQTAYPAIGSGTFHKNRLTAEPIGILVRIAIL
jgi:hypothetical protein